MMNLQLQVEEKYSEKNIQEKQKVKSARWSKLTTEKK